MKYGQRTSVRASTLIKNLLTDKRHVERNWEKVSQYEMAKEFPLPDHLQWERRYSVDSFNGWCVRYKSEKMRGGGGRWYVAYFMKGDINCPSTYPPLTLAIQYFNKHAEDREVNSQKEGYALASVLLLLSPYGSGHEKEIDKDI